MNHGIKVQALGGQSRKFVRFDFISPPRFHTDVESEKGSEPESLYKSFSTCTATTSTVKRGWERSSNSIRSFGRSLRSPFTRVFAEDHDPSKKKVLDPRSAFVQQWNKFFVVSCLAAVFVDPLFFYLPIVDGQNVCIRIQRKLAVAVTVLRTCTDTLYLVHMALQFRTAFIAPSSRVFGRGELVIDPQQIASRYLKKDFWLDLVAVMPLPQRFQLAAGGRGRDDRVEGGRVRESVQARRRAAAMYAAVNTNESDLSWGLESKILRGPTRYKVKIVDMLMFSLEISVDEAVVFNMVKDRVREQTREWWAVEASKGAGWYLHPDVSSIASSYHDHYIPSSMSISTLTSAIQLKRLIRKGIPPTLRPKVWQEMSGAVTKRSKVPDSYYQDLCQAVVGQVTPSTRQIDHDLARTFPSHPWVDSPDGQATLRRILVAYSFRDSSVGYCQGMNYVAALLLLVMKTEEEAFWMLSFLLENVLFSESFAEDLRGCHLAQRVFKDFLKKKFPRLAQHLDHVGFNSTLITTEWFLCLFAKTFPSEFFCRKRNNMSFIVAAMAQPRHT